MSNNPLLLLCEELSRPGRLSEIEDEDGNIVPTDKALRQVSRENPDRSDEERSGQAQTVLDLAEKYEVEMD